MSSLNRAEKISPTPPVSIGSRITSFAIAALHLLAAWFVGLRLLPAAKEVFAAWGAKLPTWCQVMFTFGPAVLVSVGLIAALLTVIGEFKPALRALRPLFMWIMVVLIGASLATVVLVPPLRCGELIDPSAAVSHSTSQATNAP